MVKLEQNYRSTETILRAANAVIANNRGRIAKRLWSELGQGEQIQLRALEDEHAEARFVVGEIQRLVDEGASRAEIAVLYRTNAMSRVIEDALVRERDRLPGDRRHEVLRARRDQGRDRLPVAARQPLRRRQLHARGQLAAARHRADLARARDSRTPTRSDISVWEAAAQPDQVPGLGAAAVKALGRFMATMARAARMTGAEQWAENPRPDGRERGRATRPRGEGVPVAELLEAVLAQTGYIEALEAERTIEAQGRIENLEQLVEVGARVRRRRPRARTRSSASCRRSRSWPTPTRRSDDEGLVTLMTLHNAKGLEYPTVFITGCEDGVFPHSRAIDEGGLEEERRLFYVGVTRAMRKLYLTYARRRAVFGAQSYGMPSRFLDEIPADLLEEAPGDDLPPAAVSPSVLGSGARASAGTAVAGRSSSARRRRAAARRRAARRRPGVPPRRGRRARRVRRRRRDRRRARRGDRRALRRRRLRAQADGRVRPGQRGRLSAA